MPQSIRPGDLLAGRYRLVDLLSESGGGRFWRAHDQVLERHVAIHVIADDDDRAPGLQAAARRSATVTDRRLLRVLDVERAAGLCFVVNEWGAGTSLDVMVARNGPLTARRAAWLVGEIADTIAVAHGCGVAHGRLVPENVLIDAAGAIRVIGFCVDAALHGLPPGTTAVDVADLAGLLGFALTGAWPGPSVSSVPATPRAHGRTLRPRQVRAGVPRMLDDLVDEVLNPDGRHRQSSVTGATSARGVEALLAEFVGDPAGLAESLRAANPGRIETVVLPAVPEMVVRDATYDGLGAADPASEPLDRPGPPSIEESTEAGLPVFDDVDTDGVPWMQSRAEPAPPPPPFTEPPERPLFAPAPVSGEPIRRTRVPASVDAGTAGGGGSQDAFWPWDTGRTAVPPEPGAGIEPLERQARLPGRRSLRIAVGLAVLLLIGIGAVVVVNLGRGRTMLGEETDPTTPATRSAPSTGSSPTTTAPVALTGLSATDLDPQGRPDRSENPRQTGLAIDGDPATGWQTSTYLQQLGPGGLKTGVGLIVDLGRSTTPREVRLGLAGQPTGFSLYLTPEAPTAVDELTPVATQTADQTAQIELDGTDSGRYLTIWLTSLPAVDGGFRGEITDVQVLA